MTWSMHICGQVQGVGFRPFIWRTARAMGLAGQVVNGLDGVRIKVNGSEQEVIDFQHYIEQHLPPNANITAIYLRPDARETFFDSFTIQESLPEGDPVLSLTPDIALCDACREELFQVGNRRKAYPFITCTICGPRYSILTGLPYDRPLTSMSAFRMCEACAAEYRDPENRRYFAQTNSCPDCGIQLSYLDCSSGCAEELALDQQQMLVRVIADWQSGKIVAIKGGGGYLLTCDATHAGAIATLRERKKRPGKPFALMYPSASSLLQDAIPLPEALEVLRSAAAPVVLMEIRPQLGSGINAKGIAPGLKRIGVMLPYLPLFELLLRSFGRPIVATSANVSHAPLIYDDQEAMRRLPALADVLLMHNRGIVTPQDDSVVAFSPEGSRVMIRRGRGYAPTLIQATLPLPNQTVLALGAEMKSTFTLFHKGTVNISPYLGDLADYDVQQRYGQVLHQMQSMFNTPPEVVVHDLHPAYFTSRLAAQIATQTDAKCIAVQHHKAHFAAVLAENDLMHSPDPVLGVIWDGTGYGEDRQIWGGEFFVFQHGQQMFRCAHLSPFPMLLGDKMAREPRLSALSIGGHLETVADLIRHRFSIQEWELYLKLRARSPMQCTSIGRLFDAVAALLGQAERMSYEGEAAMLLEQQARSWCNQYGFQPSTSFFAETDGQEPLMLNAEKVLAAAAEAIRRQAPPAQVAAQFHWSMAYSIGRIARRAGVQKIAFSGGVFQNTLLIDMIRYLYNLDYQLYFHKQLSPNDECISFGQAVLVTMN